MTPFFGITHSLRALLLPHQHPQKKVKENLLWVYLSGLAVVILGPMDNMVEDFFPMHQIIIAVLDVFLPHFSCSEESTLQEYFPNAKPQSSPLLLSLALPSCVSHPGALTAMPHSGSAGEAGLQDDSRGNNELQLWCENSRFPHPKKPPCKHPCSPLPT